MVKSITVVVVFTQKKFFTDWRSAYCITCILRGTSVISGSEKVAYQLNVFRELWLWELYSTKVVDYIRSALCGYTHVIPRTTAHTIHQAETHISCPQALCVVPFHTVFHNTLVEMSFRTTPRSWGQTQTVNTVQGRRSNGLRVHLLLIGEIIQFSDSTQRCSWGIEGPGKRAGQAGRHRIRQPAVKTHHLLIDGVVTLGYVWEAIHCAISTETLLITTQHLFFVSYSCGDGFNVFIR